MDDNDSEDRVRVRAYELWEQDGRPDGRADEYWHRAAALVANEQAPGQAGALGSPEEAGPAPKAEAQAEAPAPVKAKRAQTEKVKPAQRSGTAKAPGGSPRIRGG